MHTPATRRELVSIADYAARTGMSETEIRRQIRAGTLPAETFQRPQGTYYRVIVDTPDDTPAVTEPIESVQAPSASQEPPALTMRTLDIMDALLRANAETMERQAEQIANLRERAGRAEERATALAAELERARRPWWQKLRGK
jgi:hypothetical protein